MRLNRYLASCGLGSRRQCEQLILDGLVVINGRRVANLATTVSPGDEVVCDGKLLAPASAQTIMLHKPPGVLSTRIDPKERPTIYGLLPPPLKKLHYVGRLDADSEGLLILTNDGELTQRLTHPSHKVEKEYLVAITRPLDRADIAKLQAGIPLEEGLAVIDRVEVLSPRHLSVTLHQGINRQIRRMFSALEYTVTRLARIRIGGLELGTLKPGKWRVLHEPELAKLLEEPRVRARRPAPQTPATSERRPAVGRPASTSRHPAARKTPQKKVRLNLRDDRRPPQSEPSGSPRGRNSFPSAGKGKPRPSGPKRDLDAKRGVVKRGPRRGSGRP